jgi:peptidoglycan/xylan/chitin deacetylase (PgdA/CDA1 family)
MPAFKQHISVAARGIKAFLNLEAGAARIVPEIERAHGQAAERNRRQGRRQPVSEDRKTAPSPVKLAKGDLKPENIVWIFGSGGSGSTWLSSIMADLSRQTLWGEPGVGALFGHFYYGQHERRHQNPQFIMGLHKESWLGSIRNFILEAAAATFPNLTEKEYLIINEPNGATGAPLLMEALPESRMVVLVGDPPDVAVSSADARKEEGWNYDTNGDENPLHRKRNEPPKKGSLARAKGRSKNRPQGMGNAREAYDAHRGPKVLVRYEELRTDTLGTMKRIYSTLGVPVEESELERAVDKHSTTDRRARRGKATRHRSVIDITEPIPDVLAPFPAERLQCVVKAEGEHVGMLALPICDGFVPGYVIADAIAAEFAWQILGLFFGRTLYPTLTVKQEDAGSSLWRENLRLTEAMPIDEQSLREQAHDHVGWLIFLQEVWGYPDWPASRFYDGETFRESGPRQSVTDEWAMVEVSDTVPELEVAGEELQTVFTVGGTAIGAVTIPVTRATVSPHELRVALTIASGFELCRAVVREALLGGSLAEPLPLRARLASAREARLAKSGSASEMIKGVSLAPGSAPAFDPTEFASERLLVLGRRAYEAMGTSASRRAMLPSGATEDLLGSAEPGYALVIETYRQDERRGRVIYAPELIPRSSTARSSSEGRAGRPCAQDTEDPADSAHDVPLYGRHYFEALFANRVDPWRYTNPYERKKYEQTLSVIPEEGIGRAIELGCAEGHFTERLATRVPSLVASDISQVALDRAASRLEGFENVRLVRLDFASEPLPGRFDLIICSEVLYYLENREQLRAVSSKLANALEPGGYLVTAHATQVVDEPDKPGFDWGHPFGAKVIGETLSATSGLRLLKEIRTPLYRIHLFRHEASPLPDHLREEPEIIEAEYHDPLPPEIASGVRWNGEHGVPSRGTQKVVTARLPILMYHSVSADGPSDLARYRVTPAAFEEQLRYLRDSGFRSVTLEQWRLAMEAKRPLPGRAVIITFDDGYRDFLTEAWPLLAKYGFSATVFLVAGRVGGINEWDKDYGQELSLLGWEEIRALQQEGIEFGAHSMSHRPLTELSIEEVVREALRSRTTLERSLETHIRAFAYPYGASDGAIHHLVGACGYTFGLTCRPGPSRFEDSHLGLPRIEIRGDYKLQEFAAKVGMVG